MSTTLFLTLNIVLGLLVIGAVAALVHLAHRLPSSAPHSDESWGTGGDPWVASDPLPFRQLVEHEHDRAAERAA
jgi:hypothetical protein